MKKINSKELFMLKKPFGYVSKETQQVIIDYLDLGDNDSFFHLFKNDFFIQNLLAFVCFDAVCKNISNHGRIKVTDLTIGQHIDYMDKGTYIFEGSDKNNANLFKLSPVKKRKNGVNPVNLFVPKDRLESGIGLSRSDMSRKPTKAKELLAKELGLSEFSRTNENRYIIISPKEKVEEMLRTKMKFGGSEVYFGEIVSSVWLNIKGNFDNLVHTNRSEEPVIIFAPNADTVAQYIDDYNGNVHSRRVIQFGYGDQVSDSEALGIINLQDCCQDYGISFSLYASFSYVMQKVLVNEVSKSITFQLSSMTLEKLEVECKLVHQNDNLNNNIKILDDYLDEIRDDLSLLGISYAIKRLRHLLMSVCSKDSIDLKGFLADKLSLLPRGIIEALNEINNNRFGFSEKKKVEEELKEGGHTLLIVVPDLIDSYRTEFLKYKNLEIIPMTHAVSSDLYDSKYDQVLLINPTKRYFKKWIYSQICGFFIILMPSGSIKYFENSLRGQLKMLKKLTSENYTVLMDGVDQLIRSLHEKIVNANKIESEQALDMFNDTATIEEQKIVELEADNHALSNKRIQLHSGKHINATPYFRPYILEKDLLKQVSVSKIKIGTKIVEFERINYNNVIVDKASISYKNFSNAYKRSEYWKNKLVSYARGNGLTLFQLHDRMSRIGFTRSMGFYQSWINPLKRPLVPQDSEFILYIGKLVKDKDLIQNYQTYYMDSCFVKEKIFEVKDEAIQNWISLPYSPTTYREYGLNGRIDTIIGIQDQGSRSIARSNTNKFIG